MLNGSMEVVSCCIVCASRDGERKYFAIKIVSNGVRCIIITKIPCTRTCITVIILYKDEQVDFIDFLVV